MIDRTRLRKALEEADRELDVIIKKTEKAASEENDILRISKVKDRHKYYTRPAGAPRNEEKYHKGNNLTRIKELAQADYEKRLNKAALRQKAQIRKMLRHYNEDELIKVYADMAGSRKALIDPLMPDDETYARLWQNYQYESGNFEDGAPEFYSERGERVRSKSEMILADRYLRMGIPYRYECPLTLYDGNRPYTIHPDFTVLNKRTRQVFYHEHLGRMDDENYVNKNLWRLELYQRNGIYAGENLLLTHETQKRPLDVKLFERMAERYLL